MFDLNTQQVTAGLEVSKVICLMSWAAALRSRSQLHPRLRLLLLEKLKRRFLKNWTALDHMSVLYKEPLNGYVHVPTEQSGFKLWVSRKRRRDFKIKVRFVLSVPLCYLFMLVFSILNTDLNEG
jgi:hypothetical protein